ncbi:MAG: Maf family nucleotide pyrophosphatase [Paracoccaceae bacterium]
MQRLILASGSAIRAEMLQNAGVQHDVITSRIDEQAVKSAMLSDNAPACDIADVLAEMKARRVAMKHPDALVLGADQVLIYDKKLYDKPENLADARVHLEMLRAKTHTLLSAAVIFENGAPVWRHIGRAELTMRNFSNGFLDAYIARQGADLLSSVGAYKFEDHGAQLFTKIEGDYFSVLGLPLLEILGFLRIKGICPE